MSLFKPALAAAAMVLATPALAEEPITFEAASGETENGAARPGDTIDTSA